MPRCALDLPCEHARALAASAPFTYGAPPCALPGCRCFFALSEVKLGVIPATISPYVVAKIGPSNARRLFMTGETINVEKAKEIGLVQEVVDSPEAMAKAAQAICDVMLLAAPGAVAASKVLLRNV